MNVVSNDKPVSIRRIIRRDVTLEKVLGVLDQGRRVHEIVLGIKVEIDDMVTQILEIRVAARSRVAVRIWRTHVGGEEAQDIVERDLVVVHLVKTLLLCELILGLNWCGRAEILVTPGVRCNLMTSTMHALNQGRPGIVRIVDLTFAQVIACDEESRRHVVFLQDIQYRLGIDIGAIIESQSHGSCYRAIVDTGATIGNRTEVSTNNA